MEVEEAAVDNCPERVDVAEAPRPPLIETAVDAAVLKMRFFWCIRRKSQDKTLFLLFFLPVRVCRIN